VYITQIALFFFTVNGGSIPHLNFIWPSRPAVMFTRYLHFERNEVYKASLANRVLFSQTKSTASNPIAVAVDNMYCIRSLSRIDDVRLVYCNSDCNSAIAKNLCQFQLALGP
jgi:hypothetical protein